ncbi:hypothetical protein [Actinomadura monticuli]|uniref:Large adhesin n=1 Tax=Actinomadura monticuli TaxID=3097367 RepID=A0ABV4Q7B7_9ACTN
MTSYIVVFGLIVVVVLVVVLVALGLRASRAGRDDDDWMDDEPKQPRGRRGVPPQDHMGGPDDYGPGYGEGYGDGYDEGYDGGYDRAPEAVPDRRVAGGSLGGGPLAAPTAAPSPPPPAPSGQASDEMEDDDYWATITFDKPKFPWQHDRGHEDERPEPDFAADPLHAQAPPPEQPPVEPPQLTQPVSLGADGTVLNGLGGHPGPGGGTGPQQLPAPGGFPGGAPFGNDPGSTALDPIPADLGGPPPPYGVPGAPDQPVYGGQEPQPAYGSAGDPSYGPGDPSYGGQDQYGAPEQPQYGSREPSYGDYGSDPLGGRPAAGPPPARQDFDMPLGPSGPGGPRGGDPRVSDPLGLPLGEPAAPPAPPAPAAPAPAAHAGSGGGSDTDGHKLPTVDELLQRIQSDRQRSTGPAPSADQGYGGGSLNDPLGDPLGTGSYGTTPPPASTGNTGPWPSGGQGGGYDPGLGSGGGYDSGLGGQPGYGQGQQSDGYPTAPAYGESPRYDDPLSTGGNEQPYGGSGGGVYGDFSGSSYNGAGDPLAAPHDPAAQGGYTDPNSTQAYDSGYYGGSQQQGGYQGGQQNDANPYGNRQPADDWENYRR